MFWIVIVYVLVATIIAFWIGRPLIRLSFRNEKTNAAFRYALVRLRDAAEAVGLLSRRAGRTTPAAAAIQRRSSTNYRRFVRRRSDSTVGTSQ